MPKLSIIVPTYNEIENIEPIIRQDIALLYALARLVEKFLPDGKRLRPVEVVADYEITILAAISDIVSLRPWSLFI